MSIPKVFLLSWLLSASLWGQVIDESGAPHPALLELCELVEVPQEKNLDRLAEACVKAWRQTGERWSFENRLEERRNEILPLIDRLEMLRPIHAKQKRYQYGVILGGLASSVKLRIDFLKEEFNKGVRFDALVFLTGERTLHPEKEREYLTVARTETELMLKIWEQEELPQELRDLRLIVIDAPPAIGRSRPTTESTIIEWQKTSPNPGSCLFFSSQPYVNYQHAVVKALVPPSFSIETVGCGGGKTFPISILLNTVTQELEWLNKQLSH